MLLEKNSSTELCSNIWQRSFANTWKTAQNMRNLSIKLKSIHEHLSLCILLEFLFQRQRKRNIFGIYSTNKTNKVSTILLKVNERNTWIFYFFSSVISKLQNTLFRWSVADVKYGQSWFGLCIHISTNIDI